MMILTRQKSKSVNQDQKVEEGFNYQTATFHCRLIKKNKLFGQSNRYLYIFNDTIIINQEPNKKKPNRILPIKDTKRVIWKYQQEKDKKTQKATRIYLKGFTLDYQKQSLEYYGEEETLKQLKKEFAKFLMQAKVQDEYEARSVLGEGNYAMVMELIHLHSTNVFAAKCIEKKKLQKVENGLKSVLNEIRIMRALSPHSQIINLHEIYEGDNNIYIIMDLANGGSLYSEMKKRSQLYNKQEIQIIMRNLLSSLSYVHSKGIMHRDLKPENILFQIKDDLNSLKLADFGLAAFANEFPYLYPKCGTPGFVAPEIANLLNKLDRYEVRCDVFSAGVIFHILLLGEGVFPGKGHLDILRLNKLNDIQKGHVRYESLDPNARDLLFKMLECDPMVRLSSYECLDHAYFVSEWMKQQDDEQFKLNQQQQGFQYSNDDDVIVVYKEESKQGSNDKLNMSGLHISPMMMLNKPGNNNKSLSFRNKMTPRSKEDSNDDKSEQFEESKKQSQEEIQQEFNVVD